MATIDTHRTRDGKLTYRVRIRRRGQQPIIATFPTRKEALDYGRVVEADIITGRYFPHKKQPHLLSELIDRFLCVVMPRKSEETQQTHMAPLNFWRDRLGHKSLNDIRRADVISCRDELHDRAPATICKYLSLLSGVLNYGMRELGWIDTNVVSTVSKPPLPPGRTRYLSDEERQRLLAECQKSKNRWLHGLVKMALLTGLRRGSLLNIKKDDIDLKSRTLCIPRTKNGTSLVLPLVPEAMEVVEMLLTQNGNDAYLFPGHDRKKNGWNHYDVAFEFARKRANIADGFSFHSLRHTTASYLVQAGIPLYVVGVILNHKTVAMTARYSHLATDNLKDALEVLAQRLREQ